MTLLLVGFTLLPFFGVPFLPCCLLLVLFGHVSFTWLVHTQNIAKFKTLEGCGTSLLAQKKMFEVCVCVMTPRPSGQGLTRLG